ncbi:MAG: site-2 protease family protein [Candidatus Liptonbacteria bacterium]|nr:site-2 protease family protein [Candidatus Liptonbacteria bacterium]
MLIFFLVLIGLSLLILAHEASHFAAARWFQLKIEEFGLGFPPRLWAKRKGETEYSVNWLPFGGFVKIAGENDRIQGDAGALHNLPAAERRKYFPFQPAWKRSVVILAGVTANFIAGWLLLSAVLWLGTPQLLLVGGVQPGSPAAQADLRAGDVLQGFSQAQDFIDFTGRNRGQQLTIHFQRDGEDRSVSLTPRVVTAPGEGAVGILIDEAGAPSRPFLAALKDGLIETWQITKLVVAGFATLVGSLVRHGQLAAGISGPVGIFAVAERTGGMGLIYLLQLFGLISVNLAVINLIPFPALDGGRFLFILVEKIKGSPIPYKVEAWANGIGFALLILLLVALTVRDVSQWL